jgi:hypothetical protein
VFKEHIHLKARYSIYIYCIIFNYFAVMPTKLPIVYSALLCGTMLFSCQKKISKTELETNLKTAMELYLNHQPRIDTTVVKFKVLEVTYYEAPKGYICDFKVNMKQKMPDRLIDTTGFMNANVSKDFTAVSRRD